MTSRAGNIRTISAMSPLIKEDYELLWVPYTAFTDAGNAAVAAIGGTETYGLSFDASTEEVVDTNILLPRDLDDNFDITANVYWSSSSTAATGVMFDLEYLSTGAGDDVGVAHTSVESFDTDSATADAMMISDDATFLAANITAGDVLHLVFSRAADDGDDDVTVDASLYGVRLKYTRRSL